MTPTTMPTTPVVIDDVCTPAHLVAAADAILAAQDAQPESLRGNSVGGWKSAYGILDRSAELTRIGAAILAQLRLRWPVAPGLISWAMINRAGSSHARHVHNVPQGLSGVLFVTAGDPPVPTIIETTGGELAVDPVPGRVLIIPSRMWHRVPVYTGAAPRITIAFDTGARS